MRYKNTLITAVMLTGILAVTSPAKAQERPDFDLPPVGQILALLCAERYPPGEWPTDDVQPLYPEQWYCAIGAVVIQDA